MSFIALIILFASFLGSFKVMVSIFIILLNLFLIIKFLIKTLEANRKIINISCKKKFLSATGESLKFKENTPHNVRPKILGKRIGSSCHISVILLIEPHFRLTLDIKHIFILYVVVIPINKHTIIVAALLPRPTMIISYVKSLVILDPTKHSPDKLKQFKNSKTEFL
jgi:hypothetical protein